MKLIKNIVIACALAMTASMAHALEPFEKDTPQEAANKKVALAFWREVYEAHHVELADKYLTPEYIQHNPNIPSGRESIKTVLGRTGPIDIKPQLMMPPVMVIAKGDMVLLVHEHEELDANDHTRLIKSYWFDLLRFKDGKINEHWDPANPAPVGAAYKSPPPPWVRYENMLKIREENQRAIADKAAQEGKPANK